MTLASGQPGGAAEMPRSLGVHLPLNPAPMTWTRWEVVDRATTWHVSREATDGSRTEFLLNEVHRVRIFRSLPAAKQACAKANFEADAAALAAEPLLNPAAGVCS